jgi:hypothetical protein
VSVNALTIESGFCPANKSIAVRIAKIGKQRTSMIGNFNTGCRFKIFHEIFESNPKPNKFGKEIQLPDDYPKDIILLERSKAGGGILKLRNK